MPNFGHVQDDERLDALLKELAKRAPDVLLSVSDDTYSTFTGSTRSNMTGRSPTSESGSRSAKDQGCHCWNAAGAATHAKVKKTIAAANVITTTLVLNHC